MAEPGEDMPTPDGAILSQSEYFGRLPLAEKMEVARAINIDALAFFQWLAASGFWADDGLLGDAEC